MQLPTPVHTDNTTALRLVTNKLNPKATKVSEMNYWNMRDQKDKKQFRYYQKDEPSYGADYQTKHHYETYHREIRHRYLHPCNALYAMRKSQEKKTCLEFENNKSVC